jgi:hypothetical protein
MSEGQTNITKVIVALRNFENAPKNSVSSSQNKQSVSSKEYSNLMLLGERIVVYSEGVITLCGKMQIFVVLITGGIRIYHIHLNGY